MRTLTTARAAIALLAALMLATPAYSQSGSGTLRQILTDADGDFVPDRKGDTVQLRLLVTSLPRTVGGDAQLVYAQDSTRGVVLFRRDTTLLSALRIGDVVDVTGTVSQYHGMEQLNVRAFKLTGHGQPPIPLQISAAKVAAEDWSGTLVKISGGLHVRRLESGQLTVVVRDESGSIRVFVPQRMLSQPRFLNRLLQEGHVELIGHASQRDEAAPYHSGYEIIPSDESSWNFSTIPPYRTIAWVTGLLLLSAFAFYMYFQRRRAEARAAELRELASSLERSREELRQAQKLGAVGRLAGGVAHDFNNILTAVTGNAEFVLEMLAPDDPARLEIEEIRRAADRAAGLTQQLLAFSRKQVLQPIVLDVNAAVTEVARMLQRLLGEHIDMVTHLDARVSNIYADPVQWQQVLINLAVNARDAMPRGGRLEISTSPFHAEPGTRVQNVDLATGSYVRVQVRDTGTGMDEETRLAAFDPFFTTKAVGKGSGLGLSTVYGIVKQTGGYTFIDSDSGQGCTFTIYLPATSKDLPVENAPVEQLGGPSRGSGSILIVEDEATVRSLLVRVFERDGYTVLTAATGIEALEIAAARDTAIDLLLTDVIMPGMGGRELFQRLAARQPGLRVLFISGFTGDDIMHHHVLHHSWPFLSKPFSPNEIRRKVAEVLERNASVPVTSPDDWQPAAERSLAGSGSV